MKWFNKFLTFVVTFIFAVGSFGIGNWAKADEAIYGYAVVRYYDINDSSGKEIHEHKDLTIPLKSGNGTYSFTVDSVSGYTYNNATIGGVLTTKKTFDVHVTSANTADNMVQVYCYFRKVSNSYSVTVHAMYITPAGTTPWYTQSIPVTITNGTPQTVSTESQKPTIKTYTFAYATIGENGPHINSQTVPVTVTNDNVDVYYYWDTRNAGAGQVQVVTSDNVLMNGVVVNSPGGEDYWGSRKDVTYNITEYPYSQEITVSSPSMGSAEGLEGLKFGFAVVEHNGGEPNAALTHFIYQSTSTSFQTTVNTTATTWYVHFYWIMESDVSGDLVTPDPGYLRFIPNETSWTFDENKKPAWSNSGKISNGVGDYPVEAEHVGDNPAIGKGCVQMFLVQCI